MRRALLSSLLLLALATVPAAAQRGGGVHVGGGMGGRAIGVGGRGSMGPHGGAFAARPGTTIHANGPRSFGRFGNFRTNNRFFNSRFHHHFRRNIVIWPWWGWGWGWDGWASSSYDSQQQQQTAYNQQSALQGQVQYLQEQIAEMRHDQQVQRDYAATQGAPTAPARSSDPATPAGLKAEDAGPPTMLVFHDGTRMETQNYAIMEDTLWLMVNGLVTKYPLSELDREATLKSNEARGVDLRIPQQ